MSNVKGGAIKDRLAFDVTMAGFRKIKAAGGTGTCEAVRVAARRAGCSERTYWRRLASGGKGVEKPTVTLTVDQQARIRTTRGNLHLAWLSLSRSGSFTHGYRTFLRAFRALDASLQAGLKGGATAMRKVLPFLELAPPSHFLEIVEVDHALLKHVTVYDPVTKHKGHPWVTVVIDVWSRMIIGYSVTLATAGGAATSESVFLALADALNAFGAFEWIRYDQGADFMGPVADALERLNINTSPCPAYSPWTKPYVERFIRTLKHSLLPNIAAAGFEIEEAA